MKKRNPMWMLGVKEKMIAKSKGRKFVSRGGNGHYSKHQLLLQKVTGLKLEHAIPTRPVREIFANTPYSYKVDLAHLDTKLAIEVDGKGHLTPMNRIGDKKKEQVLAELGWTVLRFTNKEVEMDLIRCADTVQSTISRLKTITTTSPTES